MTFWQGIKFHEARFISGVPPPECQHTFLSRSRNQKLMVALRGGGCLICWPGKIMWVSNQRLTNQTFKVTLPYPKPMALIIKVIMQVISRHDAGHMMAEQFFYHMWRRAELR